MIIDFRNPAISFRYKDKAFRNTINCFRNNKDNLSIVTEELRLCTDTQLAVTGEMKFRTEYYANVTKQVAKRTDEQISV